MNKFGRLKVLTLFAIVFNFNDIAFSSVPVPAKSTYDFKVNEHEYNFIKGIFRYKSATTEDKFSVNLMASDLKDYLVSTKELCLQKLGKLISKQEGIDSLASLLGLKQHMLLHGHMGYYLIFSSREGIVSSLQPRGIFNINLECKKRIAYDQIRKLNDMCATLQRDRDQASIVDLPNLQPLKVTPSFSLLVPRGYSNLDPLLKKDKTKDKTTVTPTPSAGAKSLETISEGIINWVFNQNVTDPVFTIDALDNTKFSIKATLPSATAGKDLIRDVISGEHIGNIQTRGGGFANTDKVLIGVQVRDDGRIIITSLYPVE